MWTCECGEFNNDGASFCMACKKVRISKKQNNDIKERTHETENMFRKIQEFILLDIAFLCIVAVVSFFVYKYYGFKTVDDRLLAYFLLIIVVILFQLILLIGILRMLYNAAVNSERNTFFLQKIYEMIKQDEEREKQDESGIKPYQQVDR